MNAQEKLLSWSRKWLSATNPVTASTYRGMYLRVYFEEYLI